MNLAILTLFALDELLPKGKSSIYPNIQAHRKLPWLLRASISIRESLYNLFHHNKQCDYTLSQIALRKERAAAIQSFIDKYSKTVPTDLQKKIIDSSLEELAKLLESGQTTSEQIVITFCLRAGTVGVRFNYLSYILFEEAVEQARLRDLERKNLQPGKSLPPLHGIPVSIKDQVKVKGVKHYLGLLSRMDIAPSQEDSAFVAVVRKLGAIPFCTTNVPQGLWGIVTNNNLWGFSQNPWNQDRASGGSSGGEAGLVAIRGSPIGLGTDAIGSVRIPASWCGVHSFRATSKRCSKVGRFSASGSEIDIFREIDAVVGPLANSVDDLVFFMRGIYSHFKDEDPFSIDYPFNNELYNQGLKKSGLNLGYIIETDSFEVHPSIKRAINETVRSLEAQGHNLIKLDIGDDLEKLAQAVWEAVFALGPEVFLNNNLKGEQPADQALLRHLAGALPNWMNRWFVNILKGRGEHRLAEQFEWYCRKTLIQFNAQIVKKELVKKNLVKIWKEKKLDAIILPCMPFVGPKPEGTELIWNQLLYVAPSAAFDMPAGVITVTKVQKEEEIVAGKREDIVSEAFKFQCEGSAGMPVAIQVMGMSYEDEKILGIMKQVDNIWNFREKVPLTDLV